MKGNFAKVNGEQSKSSEFGKRTRNAFAKPLDYNTQSQNKVTNAVDTSLFSSPGGGNDYDEPAPSKRDQIINRIYKKKMMA